MSVPSIVVLQFPGSNCEAETARAIRRAGMDATVFRWNDDAARLAEYDGYVIGGGFSYQDRVRSGVIAAKEPVLATLAEAAAAGKPVLGICNGAQILVEAGLVPGLEPGRVEMALAANIMRREGHTVRRDYYATWAFLRCAVPGERTAFTQLLDEGEVLPMPFAHAEGRFTTRDPAVREALSVNRQIVFQYCTPDGDVDETFPVTPNGAMAAAAAICNPAGNVLAIMPHPERAALLRSTPLSLAGPYGEWRRGAVGDLAVLDGPGPGHMLFLSMARYLEAKEGVGRG